MGQILTIRNFNAYTGRYARSTNSRTPEAQIGWYLYDSVHEKLPILALRNREPDDEWPLVWTGGRNTRMAVEATLDSLKAWRAFRPHSARALRRPLSSAVPRVLASFQRKARAAKLTCIRDVRKADRKYRRVLMAMADVVGKLSILKGSEPMLGSKIMHFLLPEFFPVWDTAWVKRTALAYENISTKYLGKWLPKSVTDRLLAREHARPAIQYARYVALMMRDLAETSRRDYRRIESAYVRHSEVDEDVVWWHLGDLAPILFEVCLLGKHNA